MQVASRSIAAYLCAMPKVDVSSAPAVTGSGYPAPFNAPCNARVNTRLGQAAGLTQFGVNVSRLPPGTWSSQRHWHEREDEFVYVIEGEVVLIEDEGEITLKAGDAAGFKAGTPSGHHFVNRSSADVLLLAIGSRDDLDRCEYPDIDLKSLPGHYSGTGGYTHKDGTPY